MQRTETELGQLWRAMTAADLPAVLALSALVHPGLPEDEAVFAERQRLYPAGCLALAGGSGLLGYALSHPWAGPSPRLNSLLGALPPLPRCYYLHDLALLPAVRGQGAGQAALRLLLAQAGALPCRLIAVGGSAPFWRRQGFAAVPGDAAMLASYGPGAVYMQRG